MDLFAAPVFGVLVEGRGPSVFLSGQRRRAGRWLLLLWTLFAVAEGVHAGWGPPQAVNRNLEFGNAPQIAVSGKSVHVVWRDSRSSVYYVRSEDCGETWSRPRTLTGTQDVETYSLAAEDGAVHFIFRVNSGDVRYRASYDGGKSWRRISTLAEYASVRTSALVVTIASAGPNVLAAWGVYRIEQAPTGRELWATWVETATSTDGGRVWTRERISRMHRSSPGLLVPNESSVGLPVVAVSGRKPRLHVVWGVSRSPDLRRKGAVLYRRGDPLNGWERVVKLARPNKRPYFEVIPLALKARRHKVHVLLQGYTPAASGSSYLYMGSDDGGESFTPRRRLEPASLYGFGPGANRLMAFDGKVIYVLGGGSEVLSSRDFGASWSEQVLPPYSNFAIAAARHGSGSCRRSVHLMQYEWPTTLVHRRFARSE